MVIIDVTRPILQYDHIYEEIRQATKTKQIRKQNNNKLYMLFAKVMYETFYNIRKNENEDFNTYVSRE